MTKTEIEQVGNAVVRGDYHKAALKFLGLKTAAGSEAAVNGVADEVRQYLEAADETRASIDAYKAAKDIASADDESDGGDSGDESDGGDSGDESDGGDSDDA